MTIRDMEILAKVAECQNMSAAAEALDISLSKVSRVISEIEKKYDVQLFDRLSKRLYLTPIGEEMVESISGMLEAQKHIEQILNHASQKERVLRIGATITVGICLLSPLLLLLKKHDSKIIPEVFVANTPIIEEKLLDSDIDIAIVEGRIKSKSLIKLPLMNDRLLLICGHQHDFFGRETISSKELSGQTWILPEKGSGTRAQFENALISNNLPYRVAWSSISQEAIKNAVADGHGITVISERLAKNDIASGRLWGCSIDGLKLSRTIDIVYHKDKLWTDQMKKFMEVCSD